MGTGEGWVYWIPEILFCGKEDGLPSVPQNKPEESQLRESLPDAERHAGRVLGAPASQGLLPLSLCGTDSLPLGVEENNPGLRTAKSGCRLTFSDMPFPA